MHEERRTRELVAVTFGAILAAACAAKTPTRSAKAPDVRAATSETVEQAAASEQVLERDLQSSLAAAPAPVVDGEKPCLADVQITQGGVVLSYAARGSSAKVARRAVRQMAAQHNQHQSETGTAEMPTGNVRSLALVEDVSGGSQVTLVADGALEAADLYSHLALDAPDLLPSGSLEQSFCQSPPLNGAAIVR